MNNASDFDAFTDDCHMCGTTDWLEKIPAGCDKCLATPPAPTPALLELAGDYPMPAYHAEGMGCGLEDRDITDRYEAMQYGWDEAMQRVESETVAPLLAALATAHPTAPAATAEAWVSVLERLPEEGQQVLLAGPFSEDMVFGRLNPNKGLRGWQIGWPYHALWSMEQYPYWHPAPAFPTPSQKGAPAA